MKVINIISLLQAKTELSEQNYTAFLDYYSIKISQNELDDIKILIRSMHSLDQRMQIFNGYYVGYTINQISKEFDLLRIGRNYIVNIESRYPRACPGYLLLQLHAELTRILFALMSNVVRYNLFIHAYATDKVTWRPNNVLFPVNLT